MEQRITLVTLGVCDLERACAFYARLGWSPANDVAAQDVAFYQCGGMVLALWHRDDLAADSGTTAHPPGAVTLAHNLRSPAEVDALVEEARAAGATIVRGGAPTDWGGYSACFHDPDGHPWEIAHNPHWSLADDGTVTI